MEFCTSDLEGFGLERCAINLSVKQRSMMSRNTQDETAHDSLLESVSNQRASPSFLLRHRGSLRGMLLDDPNGFQFFALSVEAVDLHLQRFRSVRAAQRALANLRIFVESNRSTIRHNASAIPPSIDLEAGPEGRTPAQKANAPNRT